MTKGLARRWGIGLPLILTLAACGGGGAPSDSASASAAAQSSAPAATSASSATAAPAADLASVCQEAADTEGELVYWNNLANPDPIFTAFAEAHPGIEIESLTLRPDDNAQRVLTEAASGNQITPDLIYGGLDVFQAIISRDIVKSDIDWSALGVPDELLTDAGMVRLYRTAGGLVYNSDTTDPEDLPDTWDEVIDPQWEGQVVVDPRGRPFDQLSLVWGEEETLEWVEEFVATVKPIVIEGGTAGMVAVAGGQGTFTTGGRSSETLEQQAQGTPLAIKYLDLIPTLDAYHAVISTARHPLSAQCFAAWIATDGAQVHNEAEFKSNETVPPDAPESAEIIAIDDAEKAAAVSEIGPKIGAIETGT